MYKVIECGSAQIFSLALDFFEEKCDYSPEAMEIRGCFGRVDSKYIAKVKCDLFGNPPKIWVAFHRIIRNHHTFSNEFEFSYEPGVVMGFLTVGDMRKAVSRYNACCDHPQIETPVIYERVRCLLPIEEDVEDTIERRENGDPEEGEDDVIKDLVVPIFTGMYDLVGIDIEDNFWCYVKNRSELLNLCREGTEVI